jgi:hypothetical protein
VYLCQETVFKKRQSISSLIEVFNSQGFLDDFSVSFFTVIPWVRRQFAILFERFLVFTSERVLGKSLSLLISPFGVFSDSLRSVVGQRLVSVFSCIYFPPLICFKEKRKSFISIFSCLKHLKKKKKNFHFLVW